MTAKQYLKQAYRLNELINSNLAELEQLRQLANKVSSANLTGMPSSGTKNTAAPFENYVYKIIDLERLLNDEIDRLIDLKYTIREVIDEVDSTNERLLLRLRYIEFLTWEQIAEKMSYSTMQVHRIHSAALTSVRVPVT